MEVFLASPPNPPLGMERWQKQQTLSLPSNAILLSFVSLICTPTTGIRSAQETFWVNIHLRFLLILHFFSPPLLVSCIARPFCFRQLVSPVRILWPRLQPRWQVLLWGLQAFLLINLIPWMQRNQCKLMQESKISMGWNVDGVNRKGF